MKLAIMQPYFFPYLGYFQAIHAVDKYILYENLDYITEGWMNRNRILVKNKKPTYINAKISGKSSNKKINEIRLLNGSLWKKKLIKTIELNYRGSEYFEEISPFLNFLINNENDFLYQYNAFIIKEICQYLCITTNIIYNNSNYLKLENDLDTIENGNYEKFQNLKYLNLSKKVVRVIEMCKNEKANIFINAIGGRDLYDKNILKENGIDLFFVETKQYSYRQFSKEFIPHLSIIDLLMHNGKEGTKKLIENYNLI